MRSCYSKLCLVFCWVGRPVHSNAAGSSSRRACERWVKKLISHVRRLSGTMCSQSCMLIAEAGAPSAAHPCFTNILLWENRAAEHTGFKPWDVQTWLDLSDSTADVRIGWKTMFICVFYRSWVPDEDLGASISKLVRWDLEVGHQHLHSFPVWSQKGHMGHPKHTWDFKCP